MTPAQALKINAYDADRFAAAIPPSVDPLALQESPHATLGRLREAHGLVRLGDNHFMALRCADVTAMLTDPRTRQVDGTSYAAVSRIPEGLVTEFLTQFFLFSDGADHRAKRGLFARAFSFGRMLEAKPRIRTIADGIVARLPRGEPFDFIELMSSRVPSEMIAELLGLPLGDATWFSDRVRTFAAAISPVYPRERHDEIERAGLELFEYVKRQMDRRRFSPQDDLLSTLVSCWRVDQSFDFDSLVHQVVGLILGGVDTTRAAFAMLVALLLEHRDQWDALREDPALIADAVSEGLRYEPSVGSIMRVTTEPMELCGYDLPAGAFLRVNVMSALRDPEVYADPDRFDITRADHPRLHTVFGNGAHRCIGEMLARFEMQAGLAALLHAVPDMELVTVPRMLGFGGIRQITPMTVRIG